MHAATEQSSAFQQRPFVPMPCQRRTADTSEDFIVHPRLPTCSTTLPDCADDPVTMALRWLHKVVLAPGRACATLNAPVADDLHDDLRPSATAITRTCHAVPVLQDPLWR
eukprot:jgi/Ulvmu1/5096/UM021_0113.1